MNIKDFRIGNYFRHGKKNQEVTAKDLLAWTEGKRYGATIKITEGLLLKLGFKKESDGDDFNDFPIFRHPEVVYSFCLDGYFLDYPADGYYYPSKIGDIKFVHQLQNVCYFLTGYDLSLK